MKCNKCLKTLYGNEYLTHHNNCFVNKKNKSIKDYKIKQQQNKIKKIKNLRETVKNLENKIARIEGKHKKNEPQKHWLYSSSKWQELRYKTLRKFGFKCMACNSSNVELHVDHIKPISKYPNLALEEKNLQVLCKNCNLGKSNKFEDNFVIKSS